MTKIIETVVPVAFMRSMLGQRVCLIHDRGKTVGTLIHVGECPDSDHDAVLVVELDADQTRTRLHLSEVERVKFHNPDSTRKDRRK